MDPALVRRAQRGDVDAFTQLVAERIEPMSRTAMAIIGHEADARDAVQEALASIWRSLPSLRDPNRFDAWSMRILVHASRRLARKQGSRSVREYVIRADDESSDSVAPVRATPSFDARIGERDALERAFQRLDPDGRALLVLHHLEERSVADIASILSLPAGTVKSRLHKARAELERYLSLEER
jgi:RNA polymerase sigma factor (sigma-70 family)